MYNISQRKHIDEKFSLKTFKMSEMYRQTLQMFIIIP